METQLKYSFPDKFQRLFEPKRFKVLYGGRAAGRSWACARAALIMGTGAVPGHPLQPPLRVLCVRELQNSISESIHKLIADQVDNMGMNYLYEVQRDHIFGRKGEATEGTSFSFEGIKNNVGRIRSYEGVELVVAEEAVKISSNSWNVLIPTIRRPNSEIWMNFNPEEEDDYTYKRFVLQADPTNTIVIRATFRDNPFLSADYLAEIERDRLRDPDLYLHVWEGYCRQSLEGSVYAKELRRAQEDGRITSCDWDPEWPVETAWDLGRADGTGTWFFQRIAMQHRIIRYVTSQGEDISDGIRMLQSWPYNYAMHYLPKDARAKTYGTKKSIEEIFRQHYPEKVAIVPALSLNDGINAARMLMRRCWFDERNCADGLKGLRKYSYEVRNGQFSREPSHEPAWAEAAASSFRYMAIKSGATARPDPLTSTIDRLEQNSRLRDVIRSASSSLGWMR